MLEGCRLLREGGASCAFTSLSRPGLGGLGGGVIVIIVSSVEHNSVRVPSACDDQSIHAQDIIPLVFQLHTLTAASMPKA